MPVSRLASAWLPVVAWAGLIFALSSIPDLGTGLGGWDLALRKAAHVAEYAILGALLVRAVSSPWVAVTLGALYALTDELHQHFVPGRQASALDVAIDAAGVAAGVVAVGLGTSRDYFTPRRPVVADGAPAKPGLRTWLAGTAGSQSGEPPGSPDPSPGPLGGQALRATQTPSTDPLSGQAASRPAPPSRRLGTVKAVAIDLDGVLGDTRPLWEGWLEHAARRFASIAPLDPASLPPERSSAARKLDEWAAHGIGDWRDSLERYAEDHAALHLRPDPVVGAALRRLADEGVALGVYTDAPEPLARIVLAQVGAARRVDRVEAGEDALERLLRHLGPETVVVRRREELAQLDLDRSR